MGQDRPNIYTVLAAVACIALLIGAIYTGMRNTQLTGESNPWHVVESR